VEEIQRLTSATAKLIMMFEDPWEELTFRNIGNQGGGRIFNAVEDRFLLCLTHLHGYGNWDLVRNSVRRCERFRFDFYLQSCSADALGKRCEMLMRSAERELIEIERKRQVAEAQASTVSKSKSVGDVAKERLAEITKLIAEESKRLAVTRMQLQKLKSSGGLLVAKVDTAPVTEVVEEGVPGVVAVPHTNVGRAPGYAVPVPMGLVPELCRLLIAAGPEGISKVITPFVANHPQYAKRQVEFKMHEVAIKERRPHVSDKIIWHIRDAYTKYIDMENFDDDSAHVPVDHPPAKASSGKGKGGDKSASKRKRESSGGDDKGIEMTAEQLKDLKGVAEREPKKFKRAFGFFVKGKRSEAEKELGDKASNADALRDLLTKKWETSNSDTRQAFEKMEQDDRSRYQREFIAWEEAKAMVEKVKVVGGEKSGVGGKKKKA
jgi:hypothetical protein